MGVICLHLLIKHLYLIGTWFNDDQTPTHVTEIELRPQKVLTTSHSIVNIIRRTYIFSHGVNKCALPMTVSISQEVNFVGPIVTNACTIDLLMEHGFCCLLLIDRSWRT